MAVDQYKNAWQIGCALAAVMVLGIAIIGLCIYCGNGWAHKVMYVFMYIQAGLVFLLSLALLRLIVLGHLPRNVYLQIIIFDLLMAFIIHFEYTAFLNWAHYGV